MKAHHKSDARSQLVVDGICYDYYDLTKVASREQLDKLPFSLRILLENVLRNGNAGAINTVVESLFNTSLEARAGQALAFSPARVLLQDFTGVPALVDLAAMRDAASTIGVDPQQINPLVPVDLVIDHSVMVDAYGSAAALGINREQEFKRNVERYQFLRWGQQAFNNFRVVPPGTGIVHQINLEYLASVITEDNTQAAPLLYPDTLVGTDSHTTMINGLGVLGWGVGGIEAEAAMLGQPISMLIPEVVGVKLTGTLATGATATDLVLTITEQLRRLGVVGKFVEFFGEGLASLPLADRATIANMAPEYGATCGIFPIDAETLRYLKLTGRTEHHLRCVEAYAKAQGLWCSQDSPAARYEQLLKINLQDIKPCIAGPSKPQDRIALDKAAQTVRQLLMKSRQQPQSPSQAKFNDEGGQGAIGAEHEEGAVRFTMNEQTHWLQDGDIVLAAITSCTNTSNPQVMLSAGLLAKNARALRLNVKPWVKTSLAPGSQVVPAYLEKAGLMQPLAELGFDVVGFGCTTCIGNSGPLQPEVAAAIHEGDLNVCSVLSGNRNFEGRIHPDIKSNFLASPPLVVAYALAGSMSVDLTTEPLGTSASGEPVFLKDIWPSQQQVAELLDRVVATDIFRERYQSVFEGTEAWRELTTNQGSIYRWPDSTYVKQPPYFDNMALALQPPHAVNNARCLVKLGDVVTTDHISPAGAISVHSPAGRYLQSVGVAPDEFNSLGARRGNHEVMMRGTFANPRLRNQLVPGSEGSATCYFPTGETLSIFDAAERYRELNVPLIVLAGKEYGTGSSRDWAAKGVQLLGVKAVIAESFERIHRTNLVGFGVLPLRFSDGDSAATLGLTGEEIFNFSGVSDRPQHITVHAESPSGLVTEFQVRVDVHTQNEWEYFEHGGILHYVLRELAKNALLARE